MNDMQSDIPLSWHAKSYGDVMQSLETSADGLSDREAEERLARYGTNELQRLLGSGKDTARWHPRKAKELWNIETIIYPLNFPSYC